MMEMINYSVLHDEIKQSGMTIKSIADCIGVSREGLYKKLNGESDFRLSEFLKLCSTLNIKKEQVLFSDELNEIQSEYKIEKVTDKNLRERLNRLSNDIYNSERAVFEISNELFIEVYKGTPIDLIFSELQRSNINQKLKDELAVKLADYIEWRGHKYDRGRC